MTHLVVTAKHDTHQCSGATPFSSYPPTPLVNPLTSKVLLVSSLKCGYSCCFHVHANMGSFLSIEVLLSYLMTEPNYALRWWPDAFLLTNLCLLFTSSFSELRPFVEATYFYHANLAWCCEALLASCVAAIAVSNKIVSNLPFSPLPPTDKKSIAHDFHGLSHMMPHPCFVLHVKIKFHF